MTADQIAEALWIEYLRVDEWCGRLSGNDAHSAKCAIRCVASRLGVYPEFVAKDKIPEAPENPYSQQEIDALCWSTELTKEAET